MKFALRQFARSPGLTAVIVLSLALGIGATTAVFTVVHGVLLRPPPFPEPQRIVVVRGTHLPELPDFNVSPPDYLEWRAAARSFSHLAAEFSRTYVLSGRGDAQSVLGARVTANYFDVFGLQPVLGRAFRPEEDAPGALPVVMLSHGFWQRQCGGEREVLGRKLLLGGTPHAVVGVMPAAFHPPGNAELWTPMAFSEVERADGFRGARCLSVLGRLAPKVTIEQARAELAVFTHELEQQHPAYNQGWNARVDRLHDHAVQHVRALLWVLLAAVACVELIACANIATLLLARAADRAQEMSIRSALGASRGRIIRQLLAESTMLAFAGALLGLLLASWGLDALLTLMPDDAPALPTVALNSSVLLFATGLTLFTALACGLAPAWWASRPELTAALNSGTRSSTDHHRARRPRQALVVFQIVVSVTLLAGAGLLIRLFVQLVSADPGFNPRDALVLRLALPEARYGAHEQRTAFADQLRDRIGGLPGVQSVGFAHSLPLLGNWVVDFRVQHHPDAPGLQPKTGFFAVSPGYFPAMGIRLIRGRLFTERDRSDSPPVALINEAFARQFFPGQDPLGQRLYLMKGPELYQEIVGIVADVQPNALASSRPAQAYEPLAQWSTNNLEVVVRTSGDPVLVSRMLQSQVSAIDPEQPIASVRPLAQIVDHATGRQRLTATLLSIFSGLAFVIAIVGIYGVMACTVARRTREFGLRLALGASPEAVLRQVLRQGAGLIGTGLSVGIILAIAAMRLVGSAVYGVAAIDWAVLTGVALGFAATALLACYLPARRATRVDPITALRAE